jgi:hypothetical protein
MSVVRNGERVALPRVPSGDLTEKQVQALVVLVDDKPVMIGNMTVADFRAWYLSVLGQVQAFWDSMSATEQDRRFRGDNRIKSIHELQQSCKDEIDGWMRWYLITTLLKNRLFKASGIVVFVEPV